MNNIRNSTLPKKAINSGTLMIAVIITLVIVVISIVLIVIELQKWRHFQAEVNSPSLLKTILIRK
ncbi:MAG: hypothetical protein U9O20_00200 [Patescibacteria group bacterium]|nr:hypothetical protein [Patescibacteria group bacterium]